MLLALTLTLAALACPPSHTGFVDDVTSAGDCLTVEANPDGPHTFSVASTCGPGRLHGPTGDETCDGCAVDVRVEDAADVTIDVATLAEGAHVALVYLFEADSGDEVEVTVDAIGPETFDCDTADTADNGEDDAGGGCSHTGGAPLGVVGVIGISGLALARRRVRR